jgi:hypothetical protein
MPQSTQPENFSRLLYTLMGGFYEFNMSVSVAEPECGTAGCIHGHAAVVFPDCRSTTYIGPGHYADTLKVARKLGMPFKTYVEMTHRPRDIHGVLIRYDQIDRHQAAQALNRWNETGETYYDRT